MNSFYSSDMTASIPVTFEHDGKQYNGVLVDVLGPGNTIWHLYVNGGFWGQLVYSERWGWQYHNHKGDLKHLANYFGEVVIAWYQ